MTDIAIPLKLTGFEERFGVLAHEEPESAWEIRWPIKYLPDSVNLGDTVTVKLFTKKQEDATQRRGLEDAPFGRATGLVEPRLDLEDEEKYARMRRLLEELIN